jgi:hypothetical protein
MRSQERNASDVIGDIIAIFLLFSNLVFAKENKPCIHTTANCFSSANFVEMFKLENI